ncbi:hypothetical protein AB0G02_30105 [Actinosynnema sp. NPDC023658]|uniref:hypothetical protein n=1 Tax=Actinosynnema sp. NPDC023658 TaxID=3155465 RepID=UPI0033C3F52C
MIGVHPAWLPGSAFRALGSRRVRVTGEGVVVATVRAEVEAAVAEHGGALVDDGPSDLDLVCAPDDGEPDPEAFVVGRAGTTTVVRATGGAGLLYGLHHVVRLGESAFRGAAEPQRHAPRQPVRMLDHWDNVDVHPVMGQVERGYSGGSIFYADGAVRADLSRVRAYARLLGSVGVNRVGLNNVNVGRTEAGLLTELLPEVVRLAEVFRPHGIRVHLSVSFAAPITLGGLPTADPLDPAVRDWWARTTAEVYAAIPDFGGYVVKADSEGQPGPFAYGRDHAEGANVLARALAPFGGTVFWRAFVYNHHQDWRDRTTDRARAAYDHFAPLDGRFDPNVVLQVKAGPMDFQTREPVSPVIAGMPRTRLAVEFQVTQEYTGHQKHVCHLVPLWREMLGFRPWGEDGPTVADSAAGRATAPAGGVVAVSNVGDDPFWTGHRDDLGVQRAGDGDAGQTGRRGDAQGVGGEPPAVGRGLDLAHGGREAGAVGLRLQPVEGDVPLDVVGRRGQVAATARHDLARGARRGDGLVRAGRHRRGADLHQAGRIGRRRCDDDQPGHHGRGDRCSQDHGSTSRFG